MDDRTALHTQVLNSLEDQVAVIDKQGNIVDVNAAWIQFGADHGLAEGVSHQKFNYLSVLSDAACDGESQTDEVRQGISAVIEGDRDSFYFEYPCDSPDEKRWFMMRITPLKDASNQYFVVSHHDITLRKLAEERAERLAMHDPLTGLGNRRFFDQFLVTEFARSIRSQAAISLIELDIDNFKNFNDDCGHPAGDRCLIKVGEVLRDFTQRPSDLAVRLGGDEFALVLGDTGAEGARSVAETLRDTISKLDTGLDESPSLTISVGVASISPLEQQHKETLLKEADEALYRAKAAGRNQVMQAQLGS